MWKGNILWNTTGGSIPADGSKIVNPGLVIDKSGVLHITAGSPAIGAGIGEYPFVNIDIDGQLLGSVSGTGSDQFAATPVTNRPLTTADVGPDTVS